MAWWKGLGGIPFEPEIRSVVDANRRVFESLGCVVEDAEPDFAGVDQAFPALRYAANHPQYAPLVRERPEWVKDTIKYEVAEAERITGADLGRALARQARMFEQSRQFFEQYDYFVLPVTQVAPFDVNVPYPTADRGNADGDLHRLDALVLVRDASCRTRRSPCPPGSRPDGLPVGIQIVGRHRDDWSVLQIAHAFEQATHHGRRRPALLNG